jgi:TRAP-type mannitol/chloroaromatic compound transport system permease large subunit
VRVELAPVARAIMRSSFATRRVSAWVFVISITGWSWSIAPTLLDGVVLVNHLVLDAG